MSGPPIEGTNGGQTVDSNVVWSATGLNNGNHVLVVTRGTTNYAVVDGFM